MAATQPKRAAAAKRPIAQHRGLQRQEHSTTGQQQQQQQQWQERSTTGQQQQQPDFNGNANVPDAVILTEAHPGGLEQPRVENEQCSNVICDTEDAPQYSLGHLDLGPRQHTHPVQAAAVLVQQAPEDLQQWYTHAPSPSPGHSIDLTAVDPDELTCTSQVLPFCESPAGKHQSAAAMSRPHVSQLTGLVLTCMIFKPRHLAADCRMALITVGALASGQRLLYALLASALCSQLVSADCDRIWAWPGKASPGNMTYLSGSPVMCQEDDGMLLNTAKSSPMQERVLPPLPSQRESDPVQRLVMSAPPHRKQPRRAIHASAASSKTRLPLPEPNSKPAVRQRLSSATSQTDRQADADSGRRAQQVPPALTAAAAEGTVADDNDAPHEDGITLPLADMQVSQQSRSLLSD